MELFIIAIVAIAAFAAVLYPLLRGRGGTADDATEFDGPAAPQPPAMRETDPVSGRGVVPPLAAGPATPVSPVGTTRIPPVEPIAAPTDRAGLEAEVARYRIALRAGTICRKCGEANSADSRFCAECGAALPLSESHEFE